MPKALITCHHLQRHFETFRPQYDAAGVTAVLPEIGGQQLDANEMRSLIAGCDAVIAGDDEIDASVLQVAKESGTRAIIKWGIGTDGIDKTSAASLGIPVYNTPGVFSDEVSDLAMSLLLMLTRGTHLMHQSVIDGGWLKIEGRTLAGFTAGVIGLGSIGRGIAQRAQGFGMPVLGYDVVSLRGDDLRPLGVSQLPLGDVLAKSDVLFLACNLTADNQHLLDDAAFAAMKPGAYVINVSRGPLIDEGALARALESGKLLGAGLDVFEEEPLPSSSRLRQLENCVFCTHNGSNTKEAVQRINQMTTDILFNVLGAKSPPGLQLNRVA